MSNSMPEDERIAYMRVFTFAVVERNITFGVADAFVDWFTRIGRHTYPDDIAAALEHWLSREHRRPDH
jgi:hypothetical protein